MTYLSWSPFEVDRVEEHRKYANENLNKIFMIIGIPGKTTFTTAQPCENAKLKYPSLSIFDWKTQFSWIIGFQEKVEMSQLSLGEWLLGDQEAYLKNLGVWNVHNVLNYIVENDLYRKGKSPATTHCSGKNDARSGDLGQS